MVYAQVLGLKSDGQLLSARHGGTYPKNSPSATRRIGVPLASAVRNGTLFLPKLVQTALEGKMYTLTYYPTTIEWYVDQLSHSQDIAE